MTNNRIYLVTGAAGFLGGTACRQLIRDEVAYLKEKGLIGDTAEDAQDVKMRGTPVSTSVVAA